MKKFVLLGVALLGLAVTAPARADWAGWYVGGNIGYSWGNSDTDVSYFNATTGAPLAVTPGSITSGSFSLNGLVAGLQAGHNWQSGNWVFGLETDIQWTGQKGDANFLCAATGTGGPCLPGATFLPAGTPGAALSLEQKLQWFGTLRARLGATVTPSSLIYVTGGLAWGNVKTSAALTGTTATAPPVTATATSSSSSTEFGWVLGIGFETMLSARWTGRIEYLYMDLGSVSGSVTNTVTNVRANYSSSITDNIVRIAVNYQLH